jgi:hypothetical protein
MRNMFVGLGWEEIRSPRNPHAPFNPSLKHDIIVANRDSDDSIFSFHASMDVEGAIGAKMICKK